jgi:hypothetical protein
VTLICLRNTHTTATVVLESGCECHCVPVSCISCHQLRAWCSALVAACIPHHSATVAVCTTTSTAVLALLQVCRTELQSPLTRCAHPADTYTHTHTHIQQIAASQKRAALAAASIAQDSSSSGVDSALEALHSKFREKVAASINAGPHELLRAFRRVTRKQVTVA